MHSCQQGPVVYMQLLSMWVPLDQRLLPYSICIFPGSAAMLSFPVRVR